MSFKVLARKWRPLRFADVVGQEAVVRTLTNALEGGRVAHAYLFAGVRGTGKTTMARILARAVNCTASPAPTPNPCGECLPCKEILEGNDIDLFEIDAATHTQVEKTREVIENVQYAPVRNRYKVYIIDEVHMLSTSSFNALLKTLEEPPHWAIFILATTEIHKIPATVLSRCQQFPFRRLEAGEIRGRLKEIAAAEQIGVDDESLDMVAEAAGGSLRDSLSILDQAITHGGGKLVAGEVAALLGKSNRAQVRRILEAVLGGGAGAVAAAVADALAAGADPRGLLRELERLLRALLLAKVDAPAPEGVDKDDVAALAPLVGTRSYEDLLRIYDLLLHEDGFVRRAEAPALALELVLLKARELPKLRAIEEVIRELSGARLPEAPPQSARRAERRLPPTVAAPTMPPDGDDAPPIELEEPSPSLDELIDPNLPETTPSDPFEIHVREKSPRLASFVRMADKISLEGSTLRLTFSAASAAARDVLAQAKNLAELKRIAKEKLGPEVEVALGLEEPAGGALRTVAKDVSKKELAQDRLAGKVYADPLVQRALEIFRAEIVEIQDLGAPRSGAQPEEE